MPGNDCLAEEINFINAVNAFEKAADRAEALDWSTLVEDQVAAWTGAIIGVVVGGTAAPVGGAPPGLVIGAALGVTKCNPIS